MLLVPFLVLLWFSLGSPVSGIGPGFNSHVERADEDDKLGDSSRLDDWGSLYSKMRADTIEDCST